MEITIRCPLENCSRTLSLSGEEPFDSVYLELWEHAEGHNVDPDNQEEFLELLNHVGERLV